MSRRRRRSWKRNIEWTVMEKIAEALTAKHPYVVKGLSLQTSSGVWAKANGLYTVRLVYRSERGGSLVFSFTNVALRRLVPEALA